MAVQTAEGRRLQPVRPRTAVVLVFLCLGALVGGGAGLAVAESQVEAVRANAVISVAPSSQIFQDAPSQQDESTAMVQSEIIILSGPELRQDVQRRVGSGEPVQYSAAQVGSSTVVNIDAHASTADRALASAEAVVSAYASNRQSRLRGEIERAARIVDAELGRLERALASRPLGAAALEQEYGRLLAVRSGLFRATANVEHAVTVVQPPVEAGSGVPPRVREAGLGAVLGGLLGVALLILVNSTRRRIRYREDLATSGLPVLEPDLGFYAGAMQDFTGQGQAASALRLLAAQLVRPRGGGGLVLFGATPGVGTSFVTASMAVCLSERSDVLLVLASDVVEQRDGSAAQELGVDGAQQGLTTLPRRTLTAHDVLDCTLDSAVSGVSVLGKGRGHSDAAVLRRLWQHGLLEACLDTGLTVVVDAPALSQSTTTVDLASRAGGAALVVGRKITTRRQVETVRQMFARQEIPLLGAVVNTPAAGKPTKPPARHATDDAPARPISAVTGSSPPPTTPAGETAADRSTGVLDRLRSRATS